MVCGVSPDLVLIPTEHVATVWKLGAQFIESACRDAEKSAPEIKALCETGGAQLWFAWSDHCEAAAVTELSQLPQGLKCIIFALGGDDSSRWLGYLDELEAWATTQNCNGMRIYGRKGWARKLRDYRVTRLILDKEL